MKRIDIKQIIKENLLNTRDVAEHLFPNNKYPVLALNRVSSGKSCLNVDQLSKLASLIDSDVTELFSDAWKSNCSQGSIIRFEKDDFMAELNTATNVTKLFHKESVFHESLIHKGSIPLSEYLSALDSLITKYTANEDFKN